MKISVSPRQDDCPCGSGQAFTHCCGPLLAGESAAASAEALMRSRYSAYVQGDTDYLMRSWHPRTRPAQLELEPDLHWDGLQVCRCEAGKVDDDEGRVEFIARYHSPSRHGQLHEVSRFRRVEGHWVYLDGVPGQAPGRNSPCPCGSGKKYKRCCGMS